MSGKAEENKNITIEKISAEELRDFDRNTVADAVNLLPGVTSAVTGARNEQTIYMRGFDLKHVPIFLDGIPIYVPYDGYPDLARFTTFDLSEIIVSKGFTSVLYGPNTMGGAINMVSRRPEKAFEGNAGAGYGSGNSYNGFINLGTNQNSWYVQTGASYQSSDYFNLSDDFKPAAAEDGSHRENSYQRDEKVNIKVGFTPNKDDEYAFSYIYQHGVKGTPPYAGTDPDERARYWKWPYWDKQSYYFTSKTDFDGKAYLKTRAFYDIFKNSLWSYDDDTYTTISRPYAFRSHYDDYTDGGSLEVGTAAIADHLLKLALHYKLDVHKEQNDNDPVQAFRDQMLSAGTGRHHHSFQESLCHRRRQLRYPGHPGGRGPDVHRAACRFSQGQHLGFQPPARPLLSAVRGLHAARLHSAENQAAFHQGPLFLPARHCHSQP